MLAPVSGTIAIVGRPNVGKSALFNRIVGRRIAIVHDLPGVTRDRISAEGEWRGQRFTLLDTGGIGLVRGEKVENAILKAALDQVEIAIESADVVVLVVNVQEGVVPLDREVAQRLRRAGRPVLMAVNKADNAPSEAAIVEFSELGFQEIYAVSAIHGRGIDALVDAAIALLPATARTEVDGEGLPALRESVEESAPTTPGPLKLAIVGRPNVGKSSLINALTQSERVIVSPVPGTTRDAVDVPFAVRTEGGLEEYVLIDTAGMRKARRVNDTIEFFSVKRAEQSIERCDIVVFVLDAESGILEQDKKIADKIIEARKGCIVVVNKWDLYAEKIRDAREEEMERLEGRRRTGRGDKRLTTLAEFGQWVQERLFFLDYAPVIFTSATAGLNLERLIEAVRYVGGELQKKVPTALLNRTLRDAIERRQPVSASGKRLKFFYATQTNQAPPTFLLFVNNKSLFADAYAKYLRDQLRRAFGFEGCAIVLNARNRVQTEIDESPAAAPRGARRSPPRRR